jgi:hypothetical protein
LRGPRGGKIRPADPDLADLDLTDRHVPRGQQYPVGVVLQLVRLVIDCGSSLRGGANVLGLIGLITGDDQATPHPSTCRIWLMRIGLAALTRPLDIAEDWVWMADHSIQIGQCKCLVILGIRTSNLPPGRPLTHHDMEPIALVPMINSTRQTVAVCLEQAVARTGVPRAILTDHGTDLHGGIEIFRGRHPETVEIYDLKHKAACLLRARLERDPRWKEYTGRLGTTRSAIQQTELGCLTPPSPRTKARFMNLESAVGWGVRTLGLVNEPSGLAKLGISADRVEVKLGWLRDFGEALGEWWSYHEQIGGALELVRRKGLSAGLGEELAESLPKAVGAAGELGAELIEFVRSESSKAGPGEILPGTTEVVESCFGKLKSLEGEQSRSGFTGLVLSLGAMVSSWTAAEVCEALERCRVRDVLRWCREKIGVTVQSQRKQAYSPSKNATDPG